MDDFDVAVNGTIEETPPRAEAAVGVLTDFGFLMNPVKKNLDMETRFVALGFLLTTDDVIVELPEKRATKILESERGVRDRRLSVPARDVAKVVGQDLACQLSYGLLCKLRSRYLTWCLASAARAQNYSLSTTVRGRALDEPNFRTDNPRSTRPQSIQPHVRRADFVVD